MAEAAGRPELEPVPTRRWGAFSYPAYRRYWFASLARVFGLQFRLIGAGWLVVVELDRSPVWLGVVGLASAIPTILLSVPAGVLADRFDNKTLIVSSQGLTTAAHLTLAIMIMTGQASIWVVIVWAAASGALTAIGNPSLQAILPRLIEMPAMASAVAFNSAIWNSMRIIGPALAGILIAAIGTGQAFFVTALSFIGSTVILALLRLRPLEGDRPRTGGGMASGFAFIFGNRLFLAVIGLSFFSSVFGMSYQLLMPIFADEVLRVGSTGFGFMEACAGVGALLGTLSIVRLGAGRMRGQVMIGAATVFGIVVAGFAWSTWLPLSLVMLFAAGFTSSVYLNVGMTTLQVLVPNDLRGRVMGVWSMTWFLTSVGGFVVGAGAEVFGTPAMVAVGGLAVTAFAVGLYVVSPELRAMPELDAPTRPAASAARG